jgi:hypothetical protein
VAGRSLGSEKGSERARFSRQPTKWQKNLERESRSTQGSEGSWRGLFNSRAEKMPGEDILCIFLVSGRNRPRRPPQTPSSLALIFVRQAVCP